MDFYIATAPQVWGRGFTKLQAIAAMRSQIRAQSRRAKIEYFVFKANTNQTPNAWVNDMGGLSWEGDAPKEVFHYRTKKGNA